MTDRTVLISGGGIAGPTLAFWLAAAGFRPILIEQAPRLRTGIEADINRVFRFDPFTRRERLNIVMSVGQPCRKPDVAVTSAC